MTHRRTGDGWNRKFAPRVAVLQARVLSTGGLVDLPAARTSRGLVTKEWPASAPNRVMKRTYASGIGLVAEEHGDARLELVEVAG